MIIRIYVVSPSTYIYIYIYLNRFATIDQFLMITFYNIKQYITQVQNNRQHTQINMVFSPIQTLYVYDV